MKKRFPVMVAAALLVHVTTASPVSVLPISEEELARRAEIIAVGEVEDVVSSFDEGHKTIYTFVKLRVTELIKGETDDGYVILRQMGGTVGKETVLVPGAPEYEIGDEVLVFAGPLGDTGFYGVLGIFYGKYDIELDPATGKKYVEGPSFETVHTDPVTFEQLPSRERPRPVLLEDFLAEIRSYIGRNR